MPEAATDLLSTLQRQEDELVLDSFDHTDAWALGSGMVELAQAVGHAVGIDIRRPGLILFRAALPGITADQESWIARKAALVLRMESSSALVAARLAAAADDTSPDARERRVAHARTMSWRRCAALTLEVYRALSRR